jgi:hypothetical protein
MTDYVDNMVKEFAEKLSTSNYPWNDNVFKVYKKTPSYQRKKANNAMLQKVYFCAKQKVSTKQKVITRSSTEAEVVSLDDVISKIIWTKLFLEEQGYELNQNILKRDKMSSMKLEMNCKTSSGKQTRHFNIKYVHITY